MSAYRKKPVVIEAWEFDGTIDGAPDWITGLYAFEHLTIRTLEGDMTASPGDWIIRGVKGEVYPCKPDIFAATYEPATPTPSTAEPSVEQRAGEYGEEIAGRLCDWSADGEPPVPLMQEAAAFIRTKALQSTDEVVEVLERLRPLFKRHPSPHVNDQTLNDIQALLLKLKGQSE